MESDYDEHISSNSFFVRVRETHEIFLSTATLENWVVCVPRRGSFSPQLLSDNDFLLSHILIPNEELPATHFTSLLGVEFRKNEELLISEKIQSVVLFEEIFYTSGTNKYRVWCLENPLLEGSIVDGNSSKLYKISNLNDAIAMLKCETGSIYFFKRIDMLCKKFVDVQMHEEQTQEFPHRFIRLNKLKSDAHKLFKRAIEHLLFSKIVKTKYEKDDNYKENIELALETYILDKIYDCVFDIINSNSMLDCMETNHAIQNISMLTTSDFQIEPKYFSLISAMQKDINRIEKYKTAIEKFNCLKSVIITHPNGGNFSSCLSADTLIPILVCLIAKSNLTHWSSTQFFLQHFVFTRKRINENTGCNSFLLTTLNAALSYLLTMQNTIGKLLLDSLVEHLPDEDAEFHRELFSSISDNNSEKVRELLQIESQFDTSLNLERCHPLCCCEKCTEPISRSVDTPNAKGLTALHVASMWGNPNFISMLLNEGADLSLTDNNNWTPLHHAAAHGNQSTLLLLLNSGADINARTIDRYTPLILAARNGHANCVKAILYYSDHMGIKLQKDAKNNSGETALHFACRWGFLQIVESLIEYGVSVDIADNKTQTPASLAHSSKIAALLENEFVIISPRELDPMLSELSMPKSSDDESDPDEPVNHNNRVVRKLFNAIRDRDIILAKYYLKLDEKSERNRIDINMIGEKGMTALHVAAEIGEMNFISTLLTHGADPLIKDVLGRNPLHIVFDTHNYHCIEPFLKHENARVIVKDLNDAKESPLSIAKKSHNTDLVNMLIKVTKTK